MIAVDAQITTPGVPRRIRRLMGVVRELYRPMVDLAGHWQARVKLSMRNRPPLQAAPAGQPPAVHTSEYVHSILYDVAADGDQMLLGSSSIRARILHEGGMIRPRRAKALAVPIAVESYGKRPRDFPGLDYIPAHDQEPEDKGVMGIGSGAGFLALFALRRWVRIQPHPHIEITNGDWDYFGQALERETERAVGGEST